MSAHGRDTNEEAQISRIKKGLACYRHEMNILLRLLRRRPFTEKEFDKWLSGREYRKPKIRYRDFSGDALLLGIGANGFNLWAEWLELLQYMVLLGMIDAKKNKDGLIEYRLDTI